MIRVSIPSPPLIVSFCWSSAKTLLTVSFPIPASMKSGCSVVVLKVLKVVIIDLPPINLIEEVYSRCLTGDNAAKELVS
jgi:hypothetical protein